MHEKYRENILYYPLYNLNLRANILPSVKVVGVSPMEAAESNDMKEFKINVELDEEMKEYLGQLINLYTNTNAPFTEEDFVVSIMEMVFDVNQQHLIDNLYLYHKYFD